LFSYIPITAKHIELIEGNRLAFGNIKEGYGIVRSDVTVDLAWEDLSGIGIQETTLLTKSAFVMGAPIPGTFILTWDWRYEFYLPPYNPGATTFRIGITFDFISNPIKTYVSYNYDGITSYPGSVISGLIAALEVVWQGESTACLTDSEASFCYFPRDNQALLIFPYHNWSISLTYLSTSVTEVNKYPLLKTGATHSWGIIYRDIVGRITSVIGSGEVTKYIPFPTENTNSNVANRPLISFNISHIPPPQAVSYEVVYAGNKSASWYLQLLGYNFYFGKKDHQDAASGLVLDTYRIRIKKAQQMTRDNLYNWSVEEYVWQKGDRIRIIGKVSAAGSLTEINGAIYDVEISGVFEDTDSAYDIGDTIDISTTTGSATTTVASDEVMNEWIYFPTSPNVYLIPSFGVSPNRHPDQLWVEIYRPFLVETNLFFTTGMTFEIGIDAYGNKYHKGDTDQVLDANGHSVTPAIVSNTSHDSWKYLRNFRNLADTLSYSFWAESEYASDFYLSNKLTSQGSPIANVSNPQQSVLTKRLRHGGKINIGSQVNLLADFDYDDYLDLQDEFGPIEGLRYVGFVLKALQYTKVVSIYISRQEAFSGSGDTQFLFTNKVFGSVRPAMESWGTRHPASVVVNNRHLYFWDESEGAVIRDAANGMSPISDNKMSRYFRDKAATLKAYAQQYNVWVQFGFSQATNELICLFGTGSNTQEIITFSEDDQRWKNQLDIEFSKGLMYWLGKRLFQTTGIYAYEWWAGTDYNVLTGVAVTPKLVIYAIQDPSKVKTFEAIIVYQNGGRPQFNNIQIPEKATAGAEAMQTNIYDVNIKEREGVFYCEILRDINTPGTGTQSSKEMNGRRLRGLFARIEMKPQNALLLTGKTTISNIIVLSTPSEKSQ
ncbi:MAG: hypothetical protein IMZ64_04195, partial [Bacteroidetes bacterium]|nr:hypothetical protein [Bacteroidota bacterium]